MSSNDTASTAEEPPKFILPPTKCSHCNKPASEDLKLKICARCGADSYCSRECQLARWPNHKKKCVDQGVWNLVQAIQFGDMERVEKLSKTPKVANGESKALGRGGSFMFTIPVIACVRYDKVDALRVLLESGNVTQIDRRDGDGDTALHLAASKRDNVEVMQLLLQHGADPNIVASDGFSVLMMAARDGHVANTRCLLEAGIHREDIEYTIERLETMTGGMRGLFLSQEDQFAEKHGRQRQVVELLRQYAQ